VQAGAAVRKSWSPEVEASAGYDRTVAEEKGQADWRRRRMDGACGLRTRCERYSGI